MNVRRGSLAVCATALCLLIAACSGGSVNTTPVPQSGPTAPAVPALTAFAAVTTSAVASTTGTTTLPTLTPPTGVDTGTSASIAVPPLSIGGTARASMSSTSPIGAPVISSVARSAQSVRSAQAENAPISPILFFGFGVSTPTAATVTLAYPSFTIGLPSSYFVDGTSYFMALYDPTHPSAGWQDRIESCIAAPTALTLTCSTTGTITVANNVTYYFALYAVSAAASAPTPVPTGSATTAATASPAASPTATASASASPTPTPTATATATPTTTPTTTPAPIALSTTLSSAPVTLTLPSINGVSGTATAESPGGGTTLTGTAQLNPGNGYVTPGGATTFYSAVFTSSSSSAMLQDVSATFTLPATQATGTFYLADDKSGSWVYASQGPGTVTISGATATVSFTYSGPTITLLSGTTYGVALYAQAP